MRGDLDRILLRAIHKEPERRYSTAEAFAEDLRRFLAGRPVTARRQTVAYRLSKFAQRNRWALLGAAFVVAVMATASVFTFNQSAQARRETARAESVKDFLLNLVGSADPNAEGGAAVRDEAILSVALELAEAELGGEPDMQAELFDVVGRTYVARGDFASADAPLTRALELQREIHGHRHPAVADAAYGMAALRRREKRFEEAERYYREALDIRIALEGRRSLEVSHLLNGLGANAYGAGDLDRAERFYRESLVIKEELLKEDDQEIATGRHNLALLLHRQGRYAKAEDLMLLAIDARRLAYDDRHPVMAMSYGGLGRILHAMKRYDEAKLECRRAYEIRLEAYGTDHPHTRLAQGDLAALLYDAADFQGAEEQLRSLLSAIEHGPGKNDPEYAETLCDLADVLLELGRLDEAEASYSEAGELGASVALGDEGVGWRALAGQGALALARGRLEEALSHLRPAAASYGANGRASTRDGLGVRVRLGDCLSRLGRRAEADSALQEAHRLSREDQLAYTWEARLARDRLREHLIRNGRRDEAARVD